MTSMGPGLLSTLQPDFGIGQCIVYQVLLGEGIGVGFLLSVFVVQTTLSFTDIPLPHGPDDLTFIQLLGGCIFLSVAQDIFRNRLSAGIHTALPMPDPGAVINVRPPSIQRVDSGIPRSLVNKNIYVMVHNFDPAIGLSAASISTAIVI